MGELMTSTSRKCLFAVGVFLFGFGAWAGDSECDAVDGNLVDNCGWETNCWAGWHPSAPIVDVGRDGFSHSGDYYGIVHAHPGLEYIGQDYLPTNVDQAYTLSFWVRSDSPIARLQVIWSSQDVDQTVLDLENLNVQDWTQIVVPDMVAWRDYMFVYWNFGNSVSDIDLDDVMFSAQ